MTNLEKSTDKFDDIIKYLSDNEKLELKDNIKNFHEDILTLKCTLTYSEALVSYNEKQQLNKNDLYSTYIKYVKNLKHVEPLKCNQFRIFEYDDVYYTSQSNPWMFFVLEKAEFVEDSMGIFKELRSNDAPSLYDRPFLTFKSCEGIDEKEMGELYYNTKAKVVECSKVVAKLLFNHLIDTAIKESQSLIDKL